MGGRLPPNAKPSSARKKTVRGSSTVVVRLVANEKIAGSNPVSRSKQCEEEVPNSEGIAA